MIFFCNEYAVKVFINVYDFDNTENVNKLIVKL